MNESGRVAFTLVGALAVSLILMPLAIRLGNRLGLVSRPRLFGQSDRRIPNIGGLAIGLAASVAFALVWGLPAGVGALLVGAGCAIALGLADDRSRKLVYSPTFRLIVQVIIATLAWLSGLRADSRGLVGAIGSVLFLVAAMNAFNLLDNMDGIAGTSAAATSAGIAVVALMGGQYWVASMAAALCGACLGFLPFNLSKARIYLGNGGSLLIGFLIGGAALKLRLPLDYPWTLIAIVAILAVPATDTATVIISRFLHSRPVMLGGLDHLSHRLVKLGFSPSETALAHGGAALVGAGSVAQAVFNGVPQLIAVTIGASALTGVVLMGIRVYEDSPLNPRRRFILGVAVLCGLMIVTTTSPVLAALR